MLATAGEVIRCLVTYTDWWQPASASFIPVGAARRSSQPGEGIRPGLIDSLDARTELCRRMRHLPDRDRRILFLWYVEQRGVDDIARAVGISRRQCFRRRSKAVDTLVEQGKSDAAA